MRVAVFRAHAAEHGPLFAALTRQPVRVYDVSTTDRIARSAVQLSDGEVDVSLMIDGNPIDSFSVAIFFGVPRNVRLSTLARVDRGFADSEWNAFVVSALLLSGVRLFGIPAVGPGAPPYGEWRSRGLLENAGWVVAPNETRYPCSVGVRANSEDTERHFVIFTPKRWIMPVSNFLTFEDHNYLTELCWATWELLLAYRTFPVWLSFRSLKSQYVASAIRVGLPPNTGDPDAENVASDLLY